MRRLIRSRLMEFSCLQMYVRIYLVSEVTRLYPNESSAQVSYY